MILGFPMQHFNPHFEWIMFERDLAQADVDSACRYGNLNYREDRDKLYAARARRDALYLIWSMQEAAGSFLG